MKKALTLFALLTVTIAVLVFTTAHSQSSNGNSSKLRRIRADKRIANQHIVVLKDDVAYSLSNVVVLINFSGNPKCQENLPYDSWDLGSDTVTGLAVMLKKPVPVSESRIDLTKLRKARGAYDTPDHFYYSQPEDGFQSKSVRIM